MAADTVVLSPVQWAPEVEGWTASYIHKTLWRFRGYMEFDDLMQEGRIAWWECQKAYPHISDPGHFMALYKTSFIRALDYYAHKRGRHYKYAPETRIPVRHTHEIEDHAFKMMMEEDPDIARLVAVYLEAEKPPRRGRKISVNKTLLTKVFPELLGTNIDLASYVWKKLNGEPVTLAECLV